MALASRNADKGTLADDVGRRSELLREMAERQDLGDKVSAAHDQRQAENADELRERYRDLGTGRDAGGEGDGAEKTADDADGKRERPKLL